MASGFQAETRFNFVDVAPGWNAGDNMNTSCPGLQKELLPRPNPGSAPLNPKIHMKGMPGIVFLIVIFGFAEPQHNPVPDSGVESMH